MTGIASTMTSSDPTHRLLEKAKAGDRAAFDELAGRFKPRIEHFIRSQLGTRLGRAVEVDDVLQETLFKAFRAIGTFEWRDEDSFVHWLGVIAENTIRHAARDVKQAPEIPLPAEIETADESHGTLLRRDERFDRLQGALDALDPVFRKVIVLARIEGLPVKEVARRIGRSPNATSILLYRAAIKLKEIFGDTESLSLPRRSLQDRGNTDGP